MSPEKEKQNEPQVTSDEARKHCVLVDAVRNLQALVDENFYTKQSILDVMAEDLHN